MKSIIKTIRPFAKKNKKYIGCTFEVNGKEFELELHRTLPMANYRKRHLEHKNLLRSKKLNTEGLDIKKKEVRLKRRNY